MDRVLITGGTPLHGTVTISGAKNSALPAMAASLLTSDRVTLHNIPMVRDIITMGKLLAYMGVNVTTHDFPGTDTGAHRNCPGFAARRMRHWRSSHRSASHRTATDGRGDCHLSRLHRGAL